MFVDEIKIIARAGHGGKGCVAFHREAFRPKGGPSGGNGGRGGDVVLQADHDLNNLVAQYYQPRLLAEHGQHGLGKGMDGAAGKNLVVKVPCGTLVWKLPSRLPDEAASNEAESMPRVLALSTGGRPVIRRAGAERAVEVDLREDLPGPAPSLAGRGELVADLVKHGQQFVLCRGGRGGLGNRNFATATRQAPRFAQPGEPGEEGEFLLELRLLADVGLVGWPNAGKSTLLSAVSKARPKIAPYPFTTLTPQVGIVEYPDFHRLTLCDVPGLIEGAHANIGLGHAFLRHVQRCKILVLLLDMAGADGRDPRGDYRILMKELELHDPALIAKPRLVVANKMDEPEAERNLRRFKRSIPRTRVLPISAAFGEGMAAFLRAVREAVAEAG